MVKGVCPLCVILGEGVWPLYVSDGEGGVAFESACVLMSVLDAVCPFSHELSEL